MPSARPLTTVHAGGPEAAPQCVRHLEPVRRRAARSDDRHRGLVPERFEQAEVPEREQHGGRVAERAQARRVRGRVPAHCADPLAA